LFVQVPKGQSSVVRHVTQMGGVPALLQNGSVPPVEVLHAVFVEQPATHSSCTGSQ